MFDIELWSEDHTEDVLNTTRSTLRSWRRKNCGPAFVRIGKKIAYQPKDIAEFVERERVATRRLEHKAREMRATS